MTKTDNLQKAIEALGAVEVAPGRFACPDTSPGREGTWVVFRESGCYCHDNFPSLEPMGLADVYALYGENSERVALAHAVEMPAWWSPETTTVQEVTLAEGRILHVRLDDYSRFGKPTAAKARRITASLETGEEIPA